MKRAFPKKVKPVPSHTTESDMTTGRYKQALPETNRRARTSAAMIGLAISMGAYSLLAPRQGDHAVAAEPTTNEPTNAVIPTPYQTAAIAPAPESNAAAPAADYPSASGASSVRHTVQEGETIWQLAKRYGTDASIVAAANGIAPDAVLRVGQVLVIPGAGEVLVAQAASPAGDISAGYYGPIASAAPTSPVQPAVEPTPSEADNLTKADNVEPDLSVETSLKTEQDAALTKLKQKREDLRLSLAKLRDTTASEQPSAPLSAPSLQQDATPSVPQLIKGTEPTITPVKPTSVTNGATYRVNPGDTLVAIARNYGVSTQELATANQLSNPNLIEVDQVLTIPQSTAAPVSLAPEMPAQVAKGSALEVPVISAATQPNDSSLPVVALDPRSKTDWSKEQPSVPKPQMFSGKAIAVPTQPPTVSASTTLINGANVLPEEGTAEKVAVAPFTKTPRGTQDSGSDLRYDYVENLRMEIVKLRQKYQGPADLPQLQANSATKVAAASLSLASRSESLPAASTIVNPEFQPTRSESLRSEIQELRNRVKAKRGTVVNVEATTTAQPAAQPQIVAVAPMGSEKYDPLLQAQVGKMVSPDLPALGAAEAYLPGSAGQFNGYIWPAKGVLTSGFGPRWGRMHRGIDIAAPVGTPIHAAAAGKVITAGWNSGGYGYLVEIEHEDGSVTLYAHNNRILVQAGQEVAQGQQISEMGSTGYSTGPHLHFEVHPSGRGAVNPMAFLPRG